MIYKVSLFTLSKSRNESLLVNAMGILKIRRHTKNSI
ncbi:hypothetical protein EDC18_10423 [Natranaerovirga pectinivora]|uniref:Uncharacterized protein n=1 Tax=Natranaerovirga pectinivora TaxID=682400 RepID=A0A4R3MM19_9FIRM|nr:hypothetical protein EDC18_10423 [Natranaerovirga pectinivora]